MVREQYFCLSFIVKIACLVMLKGEPATEL